MIDEWGPWIDHDGKGCPCDAGAWVDTIDMFGDREEGLASHFQEHGELCDCWVWGEYSEDFGTGIIRYRIRKPRGLTILESLMENLPDEVDA